MTDHREDLLKGDAKRQMEKYGKIVQFSNNAVVWYTNDNSTLCGPCAAEALAEYLKYKDDEDWVFYRGELPEMCDTIEQGSPVICEECNKVIFSGVEECVICKDWDDSENLIWVDGLNGMAHKEWARCAS